mmetsp:Transcript_34154/g.80391  ORF Transcript_34154/g.80391 Transcript_34154/m.80391 type:complete len:1212 (+) Transcript_34154:179-3814(+)|eukprot:CAMPEP_0172394668 /NCGR_PEP_ID=MMETSP1061-20121228/15947_1 /TAXON_ID=37318 /ORGANISM="Pseudo-nitzschia pungens, Strain cf. pungens" /LENGTH=1211 /DNA_ID=CAMNT_0013126087 /DNA_START=171 /DNA_END=3806 /DNA_ORIENTATION=+
MAPREATGTFPDQYLTFDYDITANMGMPLPPHEPFPVVTGVDVGQNDLNNTGGGAAQDDNNTNTNSLMTGSGVDAANSITNSQQPQQASSPQEAIDPLSIDPTINQETHWETDNLNMSTTSTISRIPQMPNMDHQTHSRLIQGLNTGNSPAYQQLQSRLNGNLVSASSGLDSGNDSGGSSQIHVDAPPPVGGAGARTAVGSLNGLLFRPRGGLPRRVSTSSSTSGSNLAHRVSSNSIAAQVTPPSINEGAPKTETDGLGKPTDDEDHRPPGLDITYDTMASSFLSAPSPSQDWGDDDDNNVILNNSVTIAGVNSSNGNVVCVEDDADEHSFSGGGAVSPMNLSSATAQGPVVSSNASAVSSVSSYSSMRMIQQNPAFDMETNDNDNNNNNNNNNHNTNIPESPPGQTSEEESPIPNSPNSIMLSFGPNTRVDDLKYFAERGCIVALLQALNTPRLVTLGTRMLADYAKMSHRRVAVASNRRILEFVQRTMLHVSEQNQEWLGREYAVETVRSLTATEESDRYLMGTYGLLNTLALVARGGPFVAPHPGSSGTIPLASEKARLHACIAIMNLSCGKANKIEIAKIPEVLQAMRDVMLTSGDEARLKATTCIKNLSNADANDAALLGTPGLVEALGRMATATCSPETGATPCTTNACLALMNLSISKANKHRVFRTPGVMTALMTVLERTTAQGSSTEARIKACSALSNLAIGYDNKIPMFNYPGFVDAILNVILTDRGEARTKACSILWSFAAEMKNQVPVVQRGDILPVLVRVADEDGTTEARFKCVAALTLLAESLENAIPLLESGALAPLMDILHEAGPDPTQWKGQTASWCVGFLMNIAQSDEAVPSLREAGVVELLAPLLTLDHYQSLKAAMAVTFVCRYDEGDECYDLLRKTENVIPKIISLLHNTLSGRGGNGYKYGVFTLRSSVGCISALALGPDFMKERIATGPVFESLLRVLSDFCVDGGTPGAIVGGGRDDVLSATLAVRALQSLTAHLIPIAGCSALPFGQSMEDRLLTALISLEESTHEELKEDTRQLAIDAKVRIQGSKKAGRAGHLRNGSVDIDMMDVASLASNCCGLDSIPGFGDKFLHALTLPSEEAKQTPDIAPSSSMVDDAAEPASLPAPQPVRTFLLADVRTGRRFAVPTEPSGGRAFNDSRVWCYRRGRFCQPNEEPDPNFVWTEELQRAYEAALADVEQQQSNPSNSSSP